MSENAKAKTLIAVKNIVLLTEMRNSALGNCCPSIYDDEEIAENMKKVATAQKELDAAVKYVREVTGERFKDYSDLELSFTLHTWSGIWSDERCTRLNSDDLAKLAGNNNPELLAPFIAALLDGSSPVYKFISMRWISDGRGTGHYAFSIHNPGILHKLILGEVKIA